MRDDRSREQAAERVGSTLRGKWHLDALLDTGGMASVYAATHRNGSRAAIKLLHRALSQHEDVRQRFLREGYVANKVGHPNAVVILDDDEAEDGSVFLVMELLSGESLDQRIKRGGRVSALEVLRIADQVLDVLKVAHAKGIVHRDIKPGNVFLCWDRKVKVLDFGLARVREVSAFQQKQTRDGVVMGTVNYMAPEQARGKTDLIDARTDLFAVGATMFTALSGASVHQGSTASDRMIAAASVPARSLAEVMLDAPQVLVSLVDRALAFTRDNRWPNATTMQGAVQSARVEIHAAGALSEPPPPLPPLESAYVPSGDSASRDGDVEPVEVEFDRSVSGTSLFEEPASGSDLLHPRPARDESVVEVSESMIEDAPARPRRSH